MKRKIGVFFALFCLLNSLSAKEAKSLQNLTVTAQKSEENLQDVPISMSLISQYDIEDNNIENLSDATKLAPNFSFVQTGMGDAYLPIIRGMYTDPHTASTIVGTYVDGIPYFALGNNVEMENIQRIEILKGIQATLYGKYAYAGVINIITKKPTNETNGYIKGTLGSDNKRKISAGASGAIVKDKLFVSISGNHDEKDGYIENTYLNTDDNFRKSDFAKLYLRYLPMENLEFSLISSYLKRDDGGADIAPMSLPDPRKNQSDIKSYIEAKRQTHALKIKYSYGDTDFTSITTYKKLNDDRLGDMDGTQKSIAHMGTKADSKNYSSEFRVNTSFGRAKLLGGISANKEEDITKAFFNTNPSQDDKISRDGFGIFANMDYSLMADLNLIMGLRYDKDKASIEDYLSNFKDEKSFDAILPKFGLKYKINKNISSYATLAKGYKSGGFFIYAPVGKKSFDKENSINYEIGLKTKSFNDRLLVNFAAFYMDIKDMQVTIFSSPHVGYVSNAGSASSKGFELESIFRASEDLSLFANFGYADMRYDDYKDSLGDYSGNRGQFAPKFDYLAGAKYRNSMGIFAQFDANGQSSFYADKENKHKTDGYTLYNAKIGYEAKNFETYLYCNNIEDKKYDVNGYFGSFVAVSPPREVGLDLAYRF